MKGGLCLKHLCVKNRDVERKTVLATATREAIPANGVGDSGVAVLVAVSYLAACSTIPSLRLENSLR